MNSKDRGFSLIELAMAVSITLGIGMIVFHLFHQNERMFRDQMLVVEMQQSARVVASQIADEIRMAGQGVPIYASGFDANLTEPVVAIFPTSTSNRIDFRAAAAITETNVVAPMPLDLVLGSLYTLGVENGSLFPSGKFVYIWGPTTGSEWAWIRAELSASTSTTLTVTPRQAGDAGRNGGTIRFTQSPTVSLDEAISFYMNNNTVRRASAADLTDPAKATWLAANEIGRNFASLSFAYYDRNGNPVMPDSLSNRSSIARVDVSVKAQTADALSNGDRPTYSLSLRTIPRNLQLR